MILKNSLYNIISTDATDKGCAYTLSLNPEHVIYKAHFPEMPITPGVCIIQVAKELLEEATGKSLSITMVKNVKFLRVISPVDTKEVCYSLQKITEEDGCVKVQVQVTGGEDVYAKLSFTCQIAA